MAIPDGQKLPEYNNIIIIKEKLFYLAESKGNKI